MKFLVTIKILDKKRDYSDIIDRMELPLNEITELYQF